MKKLLILSALLLLSICLQSYTCWEEDGKAIRQETQLSYSSAVINLSGGGYMVMWSDASGGRKEMKMQKVSDAGETEWDSPLILTSGGCYNPNNESLIETSDGDIVAAWTELTDSVLLRVQRLDTEGNLLWGETGLTFEVAEPYQNYSSPPQTVADEIGGVYLVWCSWSNPHAVEAIYLDEDGNLGTGWSSNGNTILFINSPTWDLSVIPDGFGGIITLMEFSDDIVLQRCDNQANLLWGAEGLSINELYTDNEIYILPWDTGEYAIITDQNSEILVNIVNSNGELSFDEPQLAASIRDGYTAGNMQVVKTSDNRLGIIYNEISGNNNNIIVQKTEIGIGTEWGEFGIEISSTDTGCHSQFNLAADDAGGMAVYWGYLIDWDFNIYYQHCDGTGNLLTGIDPILTGNSQLYNISLKAFRTADNTVLFWSQYQEDRNEIMIQIYDSEENAQIAGMGNSIYNVLAGRIGSPFTLKSKGNLSAICWQDGRNNRDQTYIQAINNDTGDLLYAENGISITVQSELSEDHGKICISENCERICVTSQVVSGGDELGVVQIIDQAGNRLLGDDGMIFCEELGVLDNEIASSGDNEFLIVWSSFTDLINPDQYLKAQKIVDEQFIWGNGVTLMVDYEHDFGDINIQYPYISWYDQEFPAIDLKLAKITEDGSIAPGWTPEGLVVSENYIGGTSQMYVNDTGIYIFWMEYNDEYSEQLRGQSFSAEGELLWEEGGRIFGDYHEFIINYQLKDDYLYYTFHEMDHLFTIYKYNLNGEFVWDDGINFENYNYGLNKNLSIWEDVIIVYTATPNNSIYPMNYDIYALIYDTDGNMIENIPPGGLEVCTESHLQSLLECSCDENGSSILLWKDGRGEYNPGSDHSLYVQKIDLTAAPVTDEEIPDGNLVNMSNYPNPFTKSTTLTCDLPRGIENAEIVIYNIKGQKVRSIPATSNEVEWDCRNQDGNLAGSGVYFYVLQGKNIQSKTGKMIMLR